MKSALLGTESPRQSTEIEGENPLRGATVANLSPAFAEELHVETTSGVMITEIDRRSLAARLGFRPGDVVLSINGRKITTVEALKEALRGKAEEWNVSVSRNGQVLKLSIQS